MTLLVQSAHNTISSGTSLTVTLGSGTTAANCLVGYVGGFQGTTNPVASGVTLGGSAGNWAAAKQALANGDANCEIWTDRNCAGSQTSVVITFTAGSGSGQENLAYVEEWSGVVSASSPVDQTGGGNGSSTAPSSGTTATLSQPNELVTGAICSAGSLTGPSSPWVNQAVITAGIISLIAGHQVVSATTGLAYAGTISPSEPWGAVIVTLKAAAVGHSSGLLIIL